MSRLLSFEGLKTLAAARAAEQQDPNEARLQRYTRSKALEELQAARGHCARVIGEDAVSGIFSVVPRARVANG